MSDGAPSLADQISKRRLYFILGALLMGMLLAALDQTIVSSALPTIVGDLHGGSHLSWVVVSYLLASTVSTPLWGKLGDQYGRKFFFQAAIVIFIVGSALSGFSQSMLELILCRALQGLGGGGLLVGASTIIGDVVSPRERGRYAGLFGGLFGVATVIGPLIGGLCVTYLNWRWIFFINLPVGVMALVVTGTVLPGALRRVRHTIDYLGSLLLSAAATVLILFLSLGGVSWRWTSIPSLGLGVGGVVLTASFLAAERRAKEPVIPLALFRVRVFNAASSVGFVMGFAMFGALTFLPLFLQDVKNVSPTLSGLRLFPLMFGLIGAAVISGRLVTRWGRYKVFPVAGGAAMTVGAGLMSYIGPNMNGLVMALYMFVFGIGLGLTMQVLVVAVQNAVSYEDLGVATSAATFFRMIGGSFGTAVFGAIYAHVVAHDATPALQSLPRSANVSAQTLDPATLRQLAHHFPSVDDKVVGAITSGVHTVFLVAIPISALAFGLAWLLPEVKLRRTVETVDPGEAFGLPDQRSSLEELQLALERLTGRENRVQMYRSLCRRARIELPPEACWLLFRLADYPSATVRQVADQLKAPRAVIDPALDALLAAGLVAGEQLDVTAGPLTITVPGHQAIDRLTEVRRQGLIELLDGWHPDDIPEVLEMVRELAGSLLADDERMLEGVVPGPGA